MSIRKTKPTPKLKSKVALEALSGLKTIKEISSKNSVHPTQVTRWKTQLQEGVTKIFEKENKVSDAKKIQKKEAELYEEIGRLKIELDWLKKKADLFD